MTGKKQHKSERQDWYSMPVLFQSRDQISLAVFFYRSSSRKQPEPAARKWACFVLLEVFYVFSFFFFYILHKKMTADLSFLSVASVQEKPQKKNSVLKKASFMAKFGIHRTIPASKSLMLTSRFPYVLSPPPPPLSLILSHSLFSPQSHHPFLCLSLTHT